MGFTRLSPPPLPCSREFYEVSSFDRGDTGVKQYFGRKFIVYILTFLIAVTIDWMIPRFMPGNPVDVLMARAGSFAEATGRSPER